MVTMINETQIEIGKDLLSFTHIDALLHPTSNYLWFSQAFQRWLEVGGRQLEEEATAKGPIEMGTAVVTSAGRLSAKHMIHFAGWQQNLLVNKKNIRQALMAALHLAVEHRVRSLALPIAGSASATFPLNAAIESTVMGLIEFCMQTTVVRQMIILPLSDKEKTLLKRLFGSINSTKPFASGLHWS